MRAWLHRFNLTLLTKANCSKGASAAAAPSASQQQPEVDWTKWEPDTKGALDLLIMTELDYYLGAAPSSLSYLVWEHRQYAGRDAGLLLDKPGQRIW